MWKILGTVFVLGGVVGGLHNWILSQQERQKKIDYFYTFLYRSIVVMETEKIKVIDYLANENSKELQEISRRLSMNTSPDGQMIWEEVFREAEQSLAFDKETFQIILQAGNGFFGKNRKENIQFLKKSISSLEELQKKCKERDEQERKVWIPVGMLGAVMLVIILI